MWQLELQIMLTRDFNISVGDKDDVIALKI